MPGLAPRGPDLPGSGKAPGVPRVCPGASCELPPFNLGMFMRSHGLVTLRFRIRWYSPVCGPHLRIDANVELNNRYDIPIL